MIEAASPSAEQDPFPVPRIDGPLVGSIDVPGSKSLSNRALILASLASSTTTLTRLLRSHDTDLLAAALTQLGVKIEHAGDQATVHGVSGRFKNTTEVEMNLGDGGTPTRFMLAASVLASEPVTIDGSARMRERPISDGVNLLRMLGAKIHYQETELRLPVRVVPEDGRFAGGALKVGPTASSQFVSALLLIAPWCREGISVEFVAPPTSPSYLELTVTLLEQLGVAVKCLRSADGNLQMITVQPGFVELPALLSIEADASSALYWAVAAAIIPGSDLLIRGLNLQSKQPDMAAFTVLTALGAKISSELDGVRVKSSLSPGGKLLGGGSFDLSNAPDGAMAIAAAAACADAPIQINGLHTLRVKESDRLSALSAGLSRVGAHGHIVGDSLLVSPQEGNTPIDAVIDTFQDHRVAMAFAVLGLRIGGVGIADPGCVAKSYPRFWQDLRRVTAHDCR